MEETSPIACMTHRSRRLSFDKKSITIAIFNNGLHPEEVARSFPLVPQFLSTTAIKPDISTGQC